MSRLALNEKNKRHNIASDEKNTENHKEHTIVCIGANNIQLWTELKFRCKYNSDVKFTTFLLNLAQKHLKKRKNVDYKRIDKSKHSKNDLRKNHFKQNSIQKETNRESEKVKSENCDKINEKIKHNRKCNENKKTINIIEDKLVSEPFKPSIDDFNLSNVIEKIDFNLTNLKECEKRTDEVNSVKELINEVQTYELTEDNLKIVDNSVEDKCKLRSRKKHRNESAENQKTKPKDEKYKGKKKTKHIDIRKAPQLDIKSEEIINGPEPEPVVEVSKEEQQRVAIKIKLCTSCKTRHLQDSCPFKNPIYNVQDSISHNLWQQNLKLDNLRTKEVDDDSENESSFAECSLPQVLCLQQCDGSQDLCVFAKCNIKEYTRFGPVLGTVVKEVDIAEDSGMQHIWEIYSEKKTIYMNTEDTNTSNWIRFVRPAPTRDLKNVLAVSTAEQLYLITTRDVNLGEELLYWQDDASGSNKKKMEKTNCGGCNLTFEHPLYYRTHCSIFHDVRYSLTIRKYHCKVCGAAILGKDNIMKHAVELHNGQGAYQCQFCKKFFLRLNYLEMHRTYGCAANPHRSRPLCDFCGRKFCQPQKLKVHIKRMHNDMSEVLREFQCKSCLKLLGSRAALQRHVKEVHQKQVDGSCTCIRCGKLFQNKSNLKIHLLTHSGVKPFKCKESNCSAAFTTKQCLQFHYKKVHGFAENIMPTIERSIEYTFAAYAGVKDGEKVPEEKSLQKDQDVDQQQQEESEEQLQDSLMCLDESSDVDDISIDDKNIDDPPTLNSPPPIISELSSHSDQTPPTLEAYTNNINTKLQSKGSKKWLGEESSQSLNLSLQQQSQKEMYSFDKDISKPDHPPSMMLDVEESQSFDRTKMSMNLNVYNRHESSNASLLVEAALDSVSDIQISNSENNVDVNGSQSCTDSLVNNLYSLSHQDNLPDVTYNHSEDLNDSRDINLISPSVNDHISVTDHDLNDDLPNRTITLDYSTFHHNDFSPESSSSIQNRSQQLIHDYNIQVSSPGRTPRSRLDYAEVVSPGTSPPRYDFHHTAENLSSDESNGIVAQNLSLNPKDKMRLDLVYKSHYGDLNNIDLRKFDNLRVKYDLEHSELKIDADFRKYHDEQTDSKYDGDLRNKQQIEMDLELRKNYEGLDADRNKLPYENSLETDIRNKTYDVIDSLELRNKTYDSIIDTEFRSDRSFEPLVLNSAELQGLDMSARSYHNFQGMNRYHPMYGDLDRASMDLRLGYSPPPPPYTHTDVLRVVSLDLTPPGRHSVDLSLRSHALHSHQLTNNRLLADHPLHNRLTLDQSRLLTNEHNRLLSDHTTNRLLSNDQLNTNRLLNDETRLLTDQSRLLDQTRLLGDSRILQPTPTNAANHDLVARSSLSPVAYTGYPVSPSPYHATSLAARTHGTSPGHTAAGYHHYSTYY